MTYEELKKIARLNGMVVVSSDCAEHSFWESYPSFFDDESDTEKVERVVLVHYMTFHPGDDVDAIINKGQPPCCQLRIEPAGMGVWSDLQEILPVLKSAGVTLEELQDRVRSMWEEE